MIEEPDVLFISHGGGPMPLLGDPGHRELVDHLIDLGGMLKNRLQFW